MELIKTILPNTLSLLTTYYCTASCRNCCFECNQNRKGKMSFEQMKSYITRCTESFPTIKLVVFSGGECFSLKNDLGKAVKFAHDKGLMTRAITNGYWANTYEKALLVLKNMKELGLDELNLSTGDDHQKWVPFANIVNALKASAELNLICLVNVEANPNSAFSEKDLYDHEELKKYIQDKKIGISSGIWIPFDPEDKTRRDTNYKEILKYRCLPRPILPQGCNSLFESIPIDPEGNVYACCGLACMRVKYLKIGNVDKDHIEEVYTKQFDDFMKIWSYVDGPKFILNKIAKDMGEAEIINADMHNCEACLLLFNNPRILNYIRLNINKYISDVILKYNIKQKKMKNEK